MPRAGAVILIATAACFLAACDDPAAQTPPPAPAPTAHDWTPQRAEFEAIAAALRDGDNPILGYGKIARRRRHLARSDLSDPERVLSRATLASLHLEAGEVDAAIREIEAAVRLGRERRLPGEIMRHVLRVCGLIYLRQAEVSNCIVRHNRDCCIFPLAGGGVHTITDPAEQARATYEALLAITPDDARTGWLLNILAMALGDHPDAVPARYRIPSEAFSSDHPIKRFIDVAGDLGVDAMNLCGGVIAEDFDGDGLLDVVTSTFDPSGPLHFYRNTGDGRFEDRSAASRLDDQLGGLNCVGADYDGDGDVDILVLRGAWLADAGRIRNSLLRNDGGVFTDVTRAAGLAEPAHPTQAAAWGDFDGDGDLDLYLVNESRVEQGGPSHPSQLFRNDGGVFTDVTAAAGVANDRFGKGVTAGDYDDDGDLDLYVSNFGVNRLYRNDGGLRFTDVAPRLGVTEPAGRSFACWFFDYDNDGALDLFVTAYDANVADVLADMLGRPHDASPPRLYRNDGAGGFADVTREAGLAHPYLPMGANFGDVDGDGWLDLYLTTGEPNYEALMPNVLLRNDAGRRFQDVTAPAGLGHLQKGHGVAFADFDNDGDQDIYHQLGGFFPGDAYRNALFANRNGGGRHVTIRLVGTRSNRQAIGARLTVTARTPGGERAIHRAVGSVSSFGGSPLRQEIGLGDATAIESIAVRWPATGATQRVEGVPLGAFITIVEGRPGYERDHPAAFDLASPATR